MKMRKDRDNRRRLQLNKRNTSENKHAQVDENRRSRRVMFAKPGNTSMLVSSNGSAIKSVPLTKRMLALILAIVFVITAVPTAVFFSLRGRAEGDDSDLTGVRLTVQLDGEDVGEAYIEAGSVEENAKNLKVDGLQEGAEFIKAVLLEDDTGLETEVKYVGGLNGQIYYSLSDKADIGTKLETSYQEIVLVYGIKRWITVDQEGHGSYELIAHEENGKYYVWNNEDLKIQKIIPDKAHDYTISTVSYVSGSANDTLDIENSAVTIPANRIKDDITVTLPFKSTNNYSIKDVSYSKGLGNGGLAETLGVDHFTSSSSNPDYFKARYLPEPVSAGGTKTFYLYSSSNTGGSNYQLNRLSINGTELEVSNVDNEDVEVELDGVKVKVHLESVSRGLYWLDNKPNARLSLLHDRDANWEKDGSKWSATGWNKKRTIYAITVSDVHTNLDIEYNFKQKANREIIIKGLRGISETAHAREKLGNGTWGTLGLPAYEYYFEQDAGNVYEAYYYKTNLIPSANLYLYRVERGYNPYSITSEVYYVEDNKVEHQESAILSGGAKVGLPEEAIRDATAGLEANNRSGTEKFNATFRKWGGHAAQQKSVPLYNDDNIYDGSDFLPIGTPYMLSYIGTDNDPKWYALALVQNSAKNQQLYLNANPYQFKIELDLDGGTLTDERFETTDGMLLETTAHSIEDPITYLPDNEPTRNDMIFEGWQLQKWNKNANDGAGGYEDVNNAVYQRMDEINIDNDTILGLVKGTSDDQRIRFQAIWLPASQASKTTVTVEIYEEVPEGTDGAIKRGGKYYVKTYSDKETQLPGDIVLLNQHTPSPASYYSMRKGTYSEGGEDKAYTKLTSTSVKQTDANVVPEANQLRIYYDFRTVDMSVRKLTRGKVKQKEFTITVKLSPDNDSPVSTSEAYAMLSHDTDGKVALDGSKLIYTKTFAKGEKITLEKLPYKWNYELDEEKPIIDKDYEPEYSPSKDGQLTKSTDVIVLNKGEQPSVETEKALDESTDNTYKITLGGYATGESYVEEFKETTPIDFTIVVDQSGSMNKGDVGSMYVPTARKGWTASSATPSGTQYYYLDPDDGQYYEVYSKSGTVYQLASSRQNLNNTLLNSSTNWSLSWWCRTNGGNFYVYDEDDDKCYYLYFLESGLESIGSYHVKFFYVKDSRINHSNASSYRTTAKGYYDAGASNVGYVTVGGKYEESYGRSVLSAGTGSVSSNSKYLDVPVYTQTTGKNSLYYQKDDGTEVQIGKTGTLTTSTVYSGRLYTEKPISRIEALQDAINEFTQTVADNAAASGVDHRVSLIGFASKQAPGWNAPGTGSNNGEYEYFNTGIFLPDTINTTVFKNYETVTKYTQVTRKYSTQDHNGTLDTNSWYYVKSNTSTNSSGYAPVVYSNGKWHLIGDSTEITPALYSGSSWYVWDSQASGNSKWIAFTSADGSNAAPHRDWFWQDYTYYAPNTYRFYASSNWDGLTSADYSNALVSANVSSTDNGKVNPVLATGINMLRAEGATFPSYGMEMANQVFENNPIPSGENRKRVVIVFSDGIPGQGDGSGIDQTEASDAIAKSQTAQNTYGADVYTVYLYGDETDSSERVDAENFLKQLASSDDFAMTANSANAIIDKFTAITEDLDLNVTTVTLGADNSYMRDVITANFDLPLTETGEIDMSKIFAKTVVGTMVDDDADTKPTWSTEEPFELTAENFVVTYNADGTKTIDIKNYDYAGNYIAYQHPGKKLEVTIDGLTIPEGKTGTMYSNTAASGIYKVDEEDSMVVEFPMPDPVTIDPLKAKVTLNYSGTNAVLTQKFPVTFKLTKSDGETGYEGEYGGYTFSSDGEFKTSMANGDTKEFDNIPPDAILTVTVQDPDDAGLYYTYTVKDLDSRSDLDIKTGKDLIPESYDEEGQKIEPSEEAVKEASKKHQVSTSITEDTTKGADEDDTRELEINIVDNRRSVTITNETQGKGDGDYSDPKKEFPIRLTIKDENGELYNGTLSDTNGREVEVKNGKAIFELAHEKSRGIYVPAGYSVKFEDDDDVSPYMTSFYESPESDADVSIENDPASATAAVTGNDNASILVIHSIDAPVVTGVVDNDHSLPTGIWAIAGVVVLAAGGFYLWKKKKDEILGLKS